MQSSIVFWATSMRKQILFGLSIFLSISDCSFASQQKKPCPAIVPNVPDQRFKPGQVWTYATRPNETSSTLTILQVDRSEKVGIIVHIRVDGIQMHAPNGNVLTSIGHTPFTRDALLLSTD